LVTGRELSSLYVFSDSHLFDWIVAENGALLHNPATPEERLLCPAASSTLVVNPRKPGIPLSVGKRVVATVRPHHAAVLVSIRELNLNLQIIFNKEAVMILPRGTERVHEFLGSCDRSVAVANAIPALRQSADLVTSGSYGASVTEVIDQLIATGRLC
jgi:hydroxymethylpyrimidine pyrophosphatase-like HAD family hydrolase